VVSRLSTERFRAFSAISAFRVLMVIHVYIVQIPSARKYCQAVKQQSYVC